MSKWWLVLTLSYGLSLAGGMKPAQAQGVSEYGAALGASSATSSAAQRGANAHSNAVGGMYGSAADSITKMTTGGNESVSTQSSHAGQGDATTGGMPDDLAPLMKTEKDLAGNEVEKDPRQTVAAAGKIANKLFYDAQAKEKAGHLSEAEQLYLRSIRVRNRFWGDKDPAVLKMYGLLGDLEMKRNNYTSAEQFYRRTLQLVLKKYGTGTYEIAPQLDSLGNAFYAQKKYYDAANYFDQVHQLRQRKFGDANPATVASALKLADAYANNEDKGWWPDSEKLLRDNIKFLDSNPDKAQLIKCLELYGRVLSKEGKEAEADKALNRLAELRSEPVVPPSKPAK